ncbi:hypothetical protein E8M01_26560 [Phreatobacter stygius]|uniref:Uncharacterized protein n=2 Tax=Phreatobacter stygius TaxID=1940610 RepID=A0A4D7BNH0_9HYPH|nr:DUF6665 family protein [Phreatobacter stygius]QCI69447.1 hypothetical protein E8M01_26560 [Phreatobacter stygius]
MEAVDTALAHEIIAEQASSLGRAGRAVAASLAALGAFTGDGPQRAALVQAAADAVFGYFVQRELCGFRRHDDAIRDYAIPREVLVRVGATAPPPR